MEEKPSSQAKLGFRDNKNDERCPISCHHIGTRQAERRPPPLRRRVVHPHLAPANANPIVSTTTRADLQTIQTAQSLHRPKSLPPKNISNAASHVDKESVEHGCSVGRNQTAELLRTAAEEKG